MKLQNWAPNQEEAFQLFLQYYQQAGQPVPQILIRPFRKGFRDRKYTPEEIRNHRGLLPEKS